MIRTVKIGRVPYLLAAACIIVLAAILLFMLLRGKDVNMDTNLSVTSGAFKNDGFIPQEYTGKGKDISPPLQIRDIGPEGKTIAIIMDDPDAPLGTFTHWLIWNIPVSLGDIPSGIPGKETVAVLGGAYQGVNDFGEIGYRGPLPPSGTHTYRIKAYVLDTVLDLKPGSDKAALQKAMEGHILQYGLLRGKFSH